MASPESTSGFAIRPIDPEEFETLGDLTVAAYQGNDDHLGDDYTRELRDVPRRAAVCPVLVAVRADGSLLGGVAYVPDRTNPLSELEHDGEAGIRMLAVDPAAQGLGVGRALAVACIERARTEGRTGVALYVRPGNLPAQRLYASLGFGRDPARDWEYERGHVLLAFQFAF